MTLYKGRVNTRANKLMDAINKSLPIDIRLLPFDIATNKAWAHELKQIDVFTKTELDKVISALDSILLRYEKGEFSPVPDDEDIHTLVERLLTEQLGNTGAKIHTGRSRNDQVICDLHLYLKENLNTLKNEIKNLIKTLGLLALEHKDTLMAGTTHLQPAQPITLGHFILSLAFALTRDFGRFSDIIKRVDRCPLGSGAIAGTGFAINRNNLATSLGFKMPSENSIDTISDRDGAQETANACSMILNHLSRYAEQFIIWSNPAFGYVKWSDKWSTGSSMMPQKRNPDAMELVRAKAARAIGNTVTLLTMTKGVPLSYAKDLQEDKEALFDSLDTASLTVQVFTQAISSATFMPDKMQAALTSDMLATDLADELVVQGVPFRTAHLRSAQFVTKLENKNLTLLDATKKELEKEFPEFKKHGIILSYTESLKRRNAIGGTAPDSVKLQIDQLNTWLNDN